MPARKTLLSSPADYLVSGTWPDGRLRKGTPNEALLAVGISRRLRAAVGERPLRDVAREVELSPQTVANLLHGRSWGDAVTVARLESVLKVQLWGDEHLDG